MLGHKLYINKTLGNYPGSLKASWVNEKGSYFKYGMCSVSRCVLCHFIGFGEKKIFKLMSRKSIKPIPI